MLADMMVALKADLMAHSSVVSMAVMKVGLMDACLAVETAVSTVEHLVDLKVQWMADMMVVL